jgi:hypothetical protein
MSSQQGATNPHVYSAPAATTPPPRNLMQRTSDKMGVWNLCAAVALGIATITVAVYYSATMLRYAKWTKHNDFREGCINDQEHHLPVSPECSEELLRARVSVVKRQLEAAYHGVLSTAGSVRFGGYRVPIAAGRYHLSAAVAGFVAGLVLDIAFNPRSRSRFLSNPLNYLARQLRLVSRLLWLVVYSIGSNIMAVCTLFMYVGGFFYMVVFEIYDIWNERNAIF